MRWLKPRRTKIGGSQAHEATRAFIMATHSSRIRAAVLLIGAGLLCLAVVSSAASAEETPAKKATGPWNLEELRRPPKVTLVEQAKTLTSLYYESEPYQGKPTRVFAYLARPEKVGSRLPAL